MVFFYIYFKISVFYCSYRRDTTYIISTQENFSKTVKIKLSIAFLMCSLILSLKSSGYVLY